MNISITCHAYRPKKKHTFITHSPGLFLTCRGKKYRELNTVLYNMQEPNVWVFKCEKTLTWGSGLFARVRISLYSSAMLNAVSQQPHLA
jgi:hypothetical protein